MEGLRLSIFLFLLQLSYTCSYPHGPRGAALLKGDPDVLTRSIHGQDDRWVPVWTAMPQLVEPPNLPPAPFNGSTATFTNTTLRQTIHLTAHTSSIRLVLSNVFGTTPLPITRATIALSRQQNATSNASGAGSPTVDPTTLVMLSFNGGYPNVTISEGATVLSDAIDFAAEAQADVSFRGSVRFGTQDAHLTRYFISALLTSSSSSHHHTSLVLIGDSLTDGRGSTTDANNRWPDQLLSLLHSNATSPLRGPLSIPNQAAGGNALLLPPSASGPNGPPALARLDRDVLSLPGGPSHVLVFIGINDIGVTAATESAQANIAAALTAGYKELVTRVRVATAWRGRTARVFAATLTPFCADAACGKSDAQPYSS
ncbi:SGNH hydrolase-type esterase domain-containing protein [Phyllosticta citribraziliensis]